MPYIDTHTSAPISEEKKAVLTKKFGRAIELIPGKSEDYLMLHFAGGCAMALGGDTAPSAMCEVTVFGSGAREDYGKVADALTRILQEELDIAPNRVYVKFSEHPYWGCGGILL